LQEFHDALKQLEVLSVVEPTKSDHLKVGNHRNLQILLSNLLQPFLEGYLSLCQILQQVCCSPAILNMAAEREIVLQLFILQRMALITV
jgi:hypothetical protein